MSSQNLDQAIAVVGLACRFPGARNPEELWRNLREGVEAIRLLSDEEMEALGVPEAVRRDPAWVPAVSLPDGIEEFDASFFGVSHREAEIIDPQQRLFLECCWEALEDAGHPPEQGSSLVGVFAGATTSTYLLFNLTRNRQVMASVDPLQLVVGNAVDSLATRVSYKLDLKGPSQAVQCACSSSLVAVHQACQSLLNHECDMVLAGGVSVNVAQRAGYTYQEDSILSPDGHCRAFDARARGTVFGGGVGVVALKRLADALADGDTVRAVILGSAINNDGAVKVGYAAPSVEGQAGVITEALEVAGVEADSISYIEAHGTGTSLGDPIEIQALTKAFRAFTDRKGFCALGSIKANIGHLDIASGIAGLIKTVLALEHREIPPSLHFTEPSPRIDFDASPVYVNDRLRPWKSADAPRRAGVSSFGFGGTNAHAILEEAPERPAPAAERPWKLLVLSARTPTALDAATRRLAGHLRRHPEGSLDDVSFTLLAGRRTFPFRRALICRNAANNADAVACLEGRDPERVLLGTGDEPRQRKIAFLFPGQGAQHAGMGRGLYDNEPVYRAEVDRSCELLRPLLGLDLREVLFPRAGEESEADEKLARTRLTQPALFVVEYSLARLWMSWGIEPQAMLGHSVGEYVAACVAGVFSLEDALAVVAERGRLIDALPEGAMLGIPLDAWAVWELASDLVCGMDRPGIAEERRNGGRTRWEGGSLSLAAINEPGRSVMAGPEEAVAELERRLAEKGIAARRLHTSHAFHSAMMEPAVAPLLDLLRRVRLAPPRIPFVSNLTGTWIRPEDAIDPAYWARHLREPVRFADGLRELLAERDRVLLEVGPGRTLTTLAARQAAGRPAIASMRHPKDAGADQARLLEALGRLWLAGHRLDPARVFAGQERRRVPLPTYPFERLRYWIEPTPGDELTPGLAAQPRSSVDEERTVEDRRTGERTESEQKLHPRPPLAVAYVAPRSEVEKRVAGVWREILGLDEVGLHDSFLELGGDSLLATRLMSRLREELSVELAVERLFEAPTVAGVSFAVMESRAERVHTQQLDWLLSQIQGLSEQELETAWAEEVGSGPEEQQHA